MKSELVSIPFMRNKVVVNVVYADFSTVEEGHPVMTYGRLTNILEKANETYEELQNRVCQLESELEKYRK
ncbi:hypothetical protein P9X10_02965 [Bacillus cereus]|nr:hypothetical protein [Bacillus cereus]